MKRCYISSIEEHFKKNRQMLFLVGPRQVGKTTIGRMIGEKRTNFCYLNWDNQDHRMLILQGPNAVAQFVNTKKTTKEKPFILFDEIHKYKQWADFLKGFYDTFEKDFHILVTGSAKLDLFKRGGDSLMGRYFTFRIHPLSLSELSLQVLENKFQSLWNFSGFPEPFLQNNVLFYNKWKKLRMQLLFQEEFRDLSRIQELDKVEVLAELIRQQTGQLVTYDSLCKKVRASDGAVRNWLKMLKALYYCFEVRPWSKNVSRSLLKEPKYFLWDWSLCENQGTKAENFVASHLLKAIHFWTDLGMGNYGLYFLRDKEKREVDFVVTKDDSPYFLVAVKLSSSKSLSHSLKYFHEKLNVPHAFQLAFDMPDIHKDYFTNTKPIIAPAKAFLSQLARIC